MQKVLAVDIGGTKTLIQFAEVTDGKVLPKVEQRYASADFESFTAVLDTFLQQHRIGVSGLSACFGVAGPVHGNNARVTNLPWSLNAEHIESHFGFRRVRLINDFQAIGYGLSCLGQQDLLSIQRGQQPGQGLRLIIGAGTGLGQCCVLGDTADDLQVLASEAGHSAFAPGTPLQNELWCFVYEQKQYVSWEDVLSGQGLENLYAFFSQKHADMLTPAIQEKVQALGVAPAVVELATQEQNPLACRILDMFVELYGSQAGNMALATMALGGVYLAGGIAPRIAAQLQSARFIEAFHRKGKMSDLMPDFSVSIINEPRVGLLGAAVAACQGS